MKKQLLIALVGFMSVASNAQTFEEKPVSPLNFNYFTSIPACFCKDAKTYLVVSSLKRVFDGGEYYGDYELSESYVYNDKLGLVKQFPAINTIVECVYSDFGKYDAGGGFLFSQTLFNDDDAFEYVECDVIVDEDEYDYRTTYMRVMSENGKELARITFDKPLRGIEYYDAPELIRMGDKNYLYISTCYFDGWGDFKRLYQINKSADGGDALQEVSMSEGLKAFPALARKNESVNIQLGSNAGGRLLVTAANGSVVRQLPVKQGQTSVQLNTRGRAAGMYVVSTVNADGTQENCKIIIK